MILPIAPSGPLGNLLHIDHENMLGRLFFWGNNAFAGATWPTANKAFYLPFFLVQPFSLGGIGIYNAGTSANTRDVGIYNGSSFALIVSSGAVAAGTINIPQRIAVTTTVLQPGFYFVGIALSTNTDTVFRFAPNVLDNAFTGVRQQDTAMPLPSTMVPAAISTSYIPLVTLFGDSFV